jgi:hypothetical protein
LTAGGSSVPAVQQLLAVLAAGKRCAETGTAFGEGAAAIASTAASLVTGDWRDELPARASFAFLFSTPVGWTSRRRRSSCSRRAGCS